MTTNDIRMHFLCSFCRLTNDDRTTHCIVEHSTSEVVALDQVDQSNISDSLPFYSSTKDPIHVLEERVGRKAAVCGQLMKIEQNCGSLFACPT